MLKVKALTVVEAELEFAGNTYKVGEVRINGFTDKDGDGDVEVGVAVNVGGMWVAGDESKFLDVELPTSMIVDAIQGVDGAFDGLVKLIGDKVG